MLVLFDTSVNNERYKIALIVHSCSLCVGYSFCVQYINPSFHVMCHLVGQVCIVVSSVSNLSLTFQIIFSSFPIF